MARTTSILDDERRRQADTLISGGGRPGRLPIPGVNVAPSLSLPTPGVGGREDPVIAEIDEVHAAGSELEAFTGQANLAAEQRQLKREERRSTRQATAEAFFGRQIERRAAGGGRIAQRELQAKQAREGRLAGREFEDRQATQRLREIRERGIGAAQVAAASRLGVAETKAGAQLGVAGIESEVDRFKVLTQTEANERIAEIGSRDAKFAREIELEIARLNELGDRATSRDRLRGNLISQHLRNIGEIGSAEISTVQKRISLERADSELKDALALTLDVSTVPTEDLARDVDLAPDASAQARELAQAAQSVFASFDLDQLQAMLNNPAIRAEERIQIQAEVGRREKELRASVGG